MSTPSRQTFAIVGGGLAAAEAVKTLRADGFDGRLVVVAEEAQLPYERPPLSKDYLRGEVGREKLLAQPAEFYEQAQVELRTGRRAVELDPRERRLTLDDERTIRFDRLLLATGARAARPALGGLDLPFVHLLRTVADADRLRESAAGAGSAVVAGGGWIAAETAASLRQLGLAVTLVVPGPEVLEKHLGAEIGSVLSDLHERHGVRVRRHSRVAAVVDGRAGRGVRLADGEIVAGDLVVLGLGATPAVELAARAGLWVSGGIPVNERLMTEAGGIFAAGDVASAWSPRYGRRMRVEHWDNARRQGRTAAHNLVGRAETYDRVPYFFSDQFDLGLESIGLPGDRDEVVVRHQDGGLVSLWLREGRVAAGMHANVWEAKKTIDQLVSDGAIIDRAAFVDPTVPISALTPAGSTTGSGVP